MGIFPTPATIFTVCNCCDYTSAVHTIGFVLLALFLSLSLNGFPTAAGLVEHLLHNVITFNAVQYIKVDFVYCTMRFASYLFVEPNTNIHLLGTQMIFIGVSYSQQPHLIRELRGRRRNDPFILNRYDAHCHAVEFFLLLAAMA